MRILLLATCDQLKTPRCQNCVWSLIISLDEARPTPKRPRSCSDHYHWAFLDMPGLDEQTVVHLQLVLQVLPITHSRFGGSWEQQGKEVVTLHERKSVPDTTQICSAVCLFKNTLWLSETNLAKVSLLGIRSLDPVWEISPSLPILFGIFYLHLEVVLSSHLFSYSPVIQSTVFSHV